MDEEATRANEEVMTREDESVSRANRELVDTHGTGKCDGIRARSHLHGTEFHSSFILVHKIAIQREDAVVIRSSERCAVRNAHIPRHVQVLAVLVERSC